MTYPPPSYSATPRYTTVDAVKKRLGINDSVWDDEIQASVTTSERVVDQVMGRSWDDVPIPSYVAEAALIGSIEFFKIGDMPGGTAGSDAEGFIGMLTTATRTRDARFAIEAFLYGEKISWGTA